MIDIEKIKNDLEQLLYKVGKKVEEGYMDEGKEVSTKSDANDLLTKYDIKSNKQIIEHLENSYPEFSIISEEAKEIKKGGEYTFVVDPIDGTRNFVRHIPVFFVGIGLIKDKKTILSITFNPITKDLFYAIKGKGAFLNGKQIKVSNKALDSSDINIRTLPDKKLEKQVVSNIIQQAFQIKNNMCSHEELSGIACDKYDGFISKGSSPWDYCHYLLVEEAGGKVTDWEGNEFDISKDNIVASNGIIHDALLQAVK